ncbi:6-phosphogluconolactonase, cycloisomerase 2 family [Asanoa ishikariensis]|uniref:6-phosphogluconolactonase, cycloisomerase 2 family n=1 Tax=Asanoa ishikariensis TaxID=137265 RepID=A0A1H3MHZ4_9ACTN|nr:6-phosphogluconolactonase, cycloisomerase 2 family [Asanoa ishikariensis]
MRTDSAPSAVYVQSNERDGNQVVVFRTSPNGALSDPGPIATGGDGDGVPHLASQGSTTLTGDARALLVTNAGSDDVSLFAVDGDGPRARGTTAVGSAPKSAAEHDGLVYVLNTGDPSVCGLRLTGGGLEPIAGSTRALEAGADPAQVGFSPDGSALVVTERATNAIVSYPVGSDGQLGDPRTWSSSGQTPYGFAFTDDGTLLVVEAFGAAKGKAATSSYATTGGDLTPVSASVGNGRSEICWAVVSDDNRFLYTTNFADSGISRYAIGDDGSLTLDDAAAGVGIAGHTGLRDEDLTTDGRFLYALDAESCQVFGWSVGASGSLSPIGSWGGLPATVAGLAAD